MVTTREQKLEQISLPAVRAGMPVRESDIKRIINSVNTLEKIHKSRTTAFPPINAGDPLTATLLNNIYVAVSDVASKAGVSMQWTFFSVSSGQPVTESMFNELIGSINLVVFKTQHDDVDVDKYVLLHNMRRELSKEKIAVLNAVWGYISEYGKCMPARLLFSKVNVPKAKAFIEEIGGSFIYETTDDGNKCYALTFVGVMQTESYFDIEELLIRYLGFVKDKFNNDPEAFSISNSEIDDALKLSENQSSTLRKIIHMAHLYSGSMGWSDDEWSVGFPEDVGELRFVEDIRTTRDRPRFPVASVVGCKRESGSPISPLRQ